MNRNDSDHPVTDVRQTLTPPPWRGREQELALFLDVDGTLLEIAGAPDEVWVDDRLPGILRRLRRRLAGAVALISGRRLDELDRLFPLSGLPAAGLHGLERRRSDGVVVRGAKEGLPEASRRSLGALAAAHPGVLIEDKGVAVAVHYRAAPGAEAAVRRSIDALMVGLAADFELLDGKMVLEIRRRGGHKGDAVASFMAEPPFRGRLPVFIGDDVTDEDGFEAANRLGGWSVRVGGVLATQARFRIADVAAVIDSLDRLAGLDDAGLDDKEMRS